MSKKVKILKDIYNIVTEQTGSKLAGFMAITEIHGAYVMADHTERTVAFMEYVRNNIIECEYMDYRIKYSLDPETRAELVYNINVQLLDDYNIDKAVEIAVDNFRMQVATHYDNMNKQTLMQMAA